MDSLILWCNDRVKLFNWCILNGLVPKCAAKLTRNYTSASKSRDKPSTHSATASSLEAVKIKMIRNLLKTERYVEIRGDKDMMRCIENEVLYNDDVINKSMSRIVSSIYDDNITGVELFNTLLGDLMIRFKDDKGKFDLNIVNNCLTERMMPMDDSILIKLTKLIMDDMINIAYSVGYTKTLYSSFTSTSTPSDDLKFLLHNGSISGLYIRLNLMGHLGCERGHSLIVGTLSEELPNMSRSRHLVFTRIMTFVAKVINSGIVDGSSYLSSRSNRDVNIIIWNAIMESIITSGIKELYYDDDNLKKELKRMGGNISIIRILRYNNEEYVYNHDYFSRVLEDVYNEYSRLKINMAIPITSFTQSLIKSHGITLANRNMYNIIESHL